MGDLRVEADGMKDLEDLLAEYVKKIENPTEILEVGAKALAEDVRRLPKPRSMVKKGGYTHLLDTVAYQKRNGEIEVGWGKYYGPMVEKGTKKMKGTPHFSPTFKKNKEKYYDAMLRKGGLQ